MSRDICIYQEFLTDAHRRQIEAAAGETGFTPHFFTPDQLEEAKACVQHCEVLYAHSPELLRAAPATLKWYCCSFAGVDPYCSDPSIFANPDCLLTNSNVYGVTIAEHVVMVTLMLLRRMPEYEAIVRDRSWSNQLSIRSIRDNEFTVLGTGDIGRYNERGELVFVSRRDFQIKHMGHRIELGEVEIHAGLVEGVRMAACIYDSENSKIVLFYVGEADPSAVMASLKQKLPRYMLPNRIQQIRQMPFTANGKINRMALKEIDQEN